MSKISAKIASKYRYFFYLMLSCSAISGSGFWLLKTFAMVEGDFGPESHFLQYPLLQLHGFSAFMMLLCLGAIFGSHIPKNWHHQRGIKSGVATLAFVVFSVLSAYSLYYLVTQELHAILANSHAIIGLFLPMILFIHIKFSRTAKKKKRRHSHEKKEKKHQKRSAKSNIETPPGINIPPMETVKEPANFAGNRQVNET